MIERLDVKNLRSFAGEHSIPLAPITLIFGPNSAGKSTLVKALGLLKQTLGPLGALAPVPRPPLVLEGSIVDFGSFPNVIYRHDRKCELSIGLQFTDPDERYASGRPIYVGLSFRAGPNDEALQTGAQLGERADLRVSFERERDSLDFVLASGDSAQLFDLVEAQAQSEENAGDQLSATNVREMAIALKGKLDEGNRLHFQASGFFPALPVQRFLDNSQTEKRFGAWFADTMYGRVEALDDLLRNLAYLGPLRAAPARFQALSRSGERSTDVGPTGEHVTRLLVEDSSVVQRVNKALSDCDIRYQLSVEQITTGDDRQIGDLVATSLLDTLSNTLVTPQDVGFGISQLLPIVVQLVANKNSTICIEQPEIHIHPDLQARVGDLLLEAAAPGISNQVIVETHSEHMIGRLQRRLRLRDDEGLVPWLTPENISVVYVDVDSKGRAVPQRLHLGDDGDFQTPWPDGFFAERHRDLFATANSATNRRPAARKVSKQELENA